MYFLSLIALLWLPVSLVIYSMLRKQTVKKVRCYSYDQYNKLTTVEPDIALLSNTDEMRLLYDVIQVTFEHNDDIFIYTCNAHDFEWPKKMDTTNLTTWIKKATVTFTDESGTTTEECTDVLDSHAGPNFDFFANEYDFQWMFLDVDFSTYSQFDLCILDVDENMYKFDILANKGNTEELYNNRGISSSCQLMHEFKKI